MHGEGVVEIINSLSRIISLGSPTPYTRLLLFFFLIISFISFAIGHFTPHFVIFWTSTHCMFMLQFMF